MNLSNGPLVVIPEPIRSMGWTYDVERSILEPLGIRLLVPDDDAAAQAALPEADVVFTSSKLEADDIARLGSNCVGILCYSVGMDYRRRRRSQGPRHPGLELPDLEQRGGLGPRDAAHPRHAASSAAVRDGGPRRELGRV